MSDTMTDAWNNPKPAPPVGLLTQTLIPSPMINWILPARLRHKRCNDVVFVGERGIQIKEVLPSGQLEDVMEKKDLGCSPVDAKVINVSSELPWEGQIPSLNTRGSTYDAENLPPQILFMATDSNELLFMCCSAENGGDFVSYSRPLPRDVNVSEKYGRHIAVDPKSRAVAVSASRNFFAIFWLKPPIEIQMQMGGSYLNPIMSEKFLRVDGDILFMEFLYPKALDDKRTLLLLIVHKDEGTRALIFEWDESSMQDNLDPSMSQTYLHPPDQLPTMIVPLAKECSYLLITTRSMAMYTPNSSRPMRYPQIIPDTGTHQVGIWTRWARPSRTVLYSQKYDGIILCREDGWIYYLEFGNDGELETQTSLGQLHCDVDTAFDVLDMGYEGGDFILAAGSQGDGGLFVQEARDHPRCVQRFINWAPVTDAITVPSDVQGGTGSGSAYDRLFVCSTSASGNGSITELRYGIEARIGVSFGIGDASLVHEMWAMPYHNLSEIFLMVSDPVSSSLFHTTPDMNDGVDALPHEEGWVDQETLAAGCTPNGDLIQVTGRAVHVFGLGETLPSCSIEHGIDSTIMAVAVDALDFIVVMATRTDEGNFLRVIRGSEDLQLYEIKPPIRLEKEPISLAYKSWGSLGIIFMGTSDGTVLSFMIDNSLGEPKQPKKFDDISITIEAGEDTSKAISSIAAIGTSSDDGAHGFLFCGLRSGILVPFAIDMSPTHLTGLKDTSSLGLKQILPKRVGNTSIKLQAQGAIALFTCGNDFWHITFSPDTTNLDFVLSRVFITDQNKPAYFPTKVSSFSLVNMSDTHPGFNNVSLFCWADNELLVCSLDAKDKTVRRRIDVPGNPNKLSYSEHLRTIIVSYNATQNNNHLAPLSLSRKPYIEFVDPDTQTSMIPSDEAMSPDISPPWRPSGSPGEKITCIFDWMPQKDGSSYHFVAVGTSIQTPHNTNERKGRILLLQAFRDTNSGQIICTDKHMQVFDFPVYAMTSFADSLIVASGKSLLPMASRNSQIKWARHITACLPSPAVKMTVHNDLIYVTTARHSLLVYKVQGGDILAVDSESLARDGLSHSFVPGLGGLHNHVFVSSRGGTVQLFSDKCPLSALVDSPTAKLPVSILRLVQGSKSPSSLATTNTIYGLAINGSVYRIVSLNSRELGLLSILVLLCMNDRRICPSLHRKSRRTIADTNLKKNSHIDGSILARLLEFGPSLLHEMLARCSSGQYSHLPASVAHEFKHAASNLIGPCEDYALNVYLWLQGLLRVEF